jgi:hypothetical protein
MPGIIDRTSSTADQARRLRSLVIVSGAATTVSASNRRHRAAGSLLGRQAGRTGAVLMRAVNRGVDSEQPVQLTGRVGDGAELAEQAVPGPVGCSPVMALGAASRECSGRPSSRGGMHPVGLNSCTLAQRGALAVERQGFLIPALMRGLC